MSVVEINTPSIPVHKSIFTMMLNEIYILIMPEEQVRFLFFFVEHYLRSRVTFTHWDGEFQEGVRKETC
jgi:hypothetical protein